MRTKLSILKEHMNAGRWEEALSLANKFPKLGKQKNEITRAHAAITNPHLYIQMGKDPAALKQLGINALLDRYRIK